MKLYEIKDEIVDTLDLIVGNPDDELAQENCKEILEFFEQELKKQKQ